MSQKNHNRIVLGLLKPIDPLVSLQVPPLGHDGAAEGPERRWWRGFVVVAVSGEGEREQIAATLPCHATTPAVSQQVKRDLFLRFCLHASSSQAYKNLD